MSHIELPGRFARKVTGPDDESHERNLEYGELRWNLPVHETALVLVDCWDDYPLESHRTRAETICRTKIKPVLETCREIGVAVVHAPSPAWAAIYPSFRYGPGPSTPVTKRDEKPPNRTASGVDWPPRSVTADDEFFIPNGRSAEPMLKDWHDENYPDNYRISASIEPAGDDVVAATGAELQEFCRERRIRHLVYAGFATNFCVLNRDYGVLSMRQRGYNIVLIRDATTAIESSESVHELWATRAAVFSVEVGTGVTVTAETFLHACKKVPQAA